MLPNLKLKLDNTTLNSKTSSSVGNKVQDFKGCELQCVKVNCVTSGPEIQIAILIEP